MRKFSFLIGLVVLSGCASDQEVCSRWTTPGSDAFANCMQNRYAQRQSAIQSTNAQTQANQQQWYHEEMQSINNAQRANAARQPSSSNCYFYGKMMHCDHY